MSWFYSKSGGYTPSDPDVVIYKANVIAAGSIVNDAALIALDAFAIGCKADSIWDSLLDVGPLCGADLTGALVKLKKLSTGWSYTNVNFVSGDYSQATGLAGDGTTKYLDADFTPAGSLAGGNCGIAVYDRSTFDSTTNWHGCKGAGNDELQLYSAWSDNKVYSSNSGTINQLTNGVALTGSVGLIHVFRASGPVHRIIRNGSAIAVTNSVSGTLPASEFYFYTQNGNGTAHAIKSPHAFSFFCITTGMDLTQAANFYTRVQALQTALGRNV